MKICKKILFICIGFFLFSLFSCQTTDSKKAVDEISAAAENISTQLLSNWKDSSNFNIAVLPFVESGTEKSNEFSDFFTDELISELFRQSEGRLVILERSQLKQLMKESEITSTGLISENTAVQFGRMIGVDTVVIGSFKRISNYLRINVRSVSIESGKIAAVATGELTLSAYQAILDKPTAPQPNEPALTLETGVLKVGFTDIYVDGYLDQDFESPKGMDARIAERLAEDLGYDLEWVLVPSNPDFFKSISQALSNRRVDMFISSTSIRPERAKEVLFSIPYSRFDGEDIGISFRIDNDSLKEEVDLLLQDYSDEGFITSLIKEYLDPVEDIFETSNTMNTISGEYIVQSCVVLGEEIPQSQLSKIEITYSKFWNEYNDAGELTNRIKLIKAGYGELNTKTIEALNPESVGSEPRFIFDWQLMKEENRMDITMYDKSGNQFGTLIMDKIE